MQLVLILFCALFAQASENVWWKAPGELLILKAPTEGAAVLYKAVEGEKIQVGASQNGYRKVFIYRESKWYSGYVSTKQLYATTAEKKEDLTLKGWGLGGGWVLSRLRQEKKSFVTQDGVQYETEDFQSTTNFPLIAVQIGRSDFWRVQVLMREAHYVSTAKTDVNFTLEKDVQLRHRMLGVAIQKGVYGAVIPGFFVAAGAEFAKSLDTQLEMNGVAVPTEAANSPLYSAIHLVSGIHLDLSRHLNLNIEGRLNWIPNQTPVIVGGEVSLALVYWP